MNLFRQKMLISFLIMGSLISAPALQASRSITLQSVDKNTPEYLQGLEYERQMQQYVPTVSGESRVIEAKRTSFTNFQVSTGAANTTGFSTSVGGGDPWDDGLRDSHVIDAYDGVIAFAWTDNATIADKTNNTLNAMVAIGTAGADGTYTIGSPVNLTGFTTQPNLLSWDTAVAINRTNPLNIVVSWGLINYNTGTALPYRAYSNDGGHTWSSPGLMTQQPANGSFGDNRGVSADKYGNIWYETTTLYYDAGQTMKIGQPYFSYSSDGGNTFALAYTVPLTLPQFTIGTSLYDYPQFCFGGLGDGSGTYGLWFDIDFYPLGGGSILPVFGFIPIEGLGVVGTGTSFEVTNFYPYQYIPSLTATTNGRLMVEVLNTGGIVGNNIPAASLLKSPGAINANYIGTPHTIALVGKQWDEGMALEESQPSRGYFNVTVQGNVYDEARQALYALITSQIPDMIAEQNMQILFYISRDNGQTWPSTPIDISSTNFANRGFSSMALDTVTGDLIFGWYDGRNDATYQSVEYFAGIVPAATLTTLVNNVRGALPSYPIYPIPF